MSTSVPLACFKKKNLCVHSVGGASLQHFRFFHSEEAPFGINGCWEKAGCPENPLWAEFICFNNPHLAWLSEHGCRIQIQKLYLPHAFLQWIHSKYLWRTYLTGLWTTTRKSILPRHTLYLACRYQMTPQFKNMYSAEGKGVLEFRIWELRAWLVWLPNLNMRTLHN